ncbi:formin-like 2 domain-containing protein [Aureococcus anophagefferens]|nr:formin-like 2 domain-containing protein [Aureococcus anophagefferens]
MAAPPGPPPQPPKPRRRGDSDSESEAESEGGGFGAALRNEQRELLARTLRLEAAVSAHAADDQLRAKRAVADAAWRHEWKRARAGYGSAAAAARERWSACFRRAARSYQAARHLEANARGDDARRAQALRVAAVRAAQLVEAARRELEGRLAAKVGGDGDAADPIRAFTTFEVRDALAAPGCSLDESQRGGAQDGARLRLARVDGRVGRRRGVLAHRGRKEKAAHQVHNVRRRLETAADNVRRVAHGADGPSTAAIVVDDSESEEEATPTPGAPRPPSLPRPPAAPKPPATPRPPAAPRPPAGGPPPEPAAPPAPRRPRTRGGKARPRGAQYNLGCCYEDGSGVEADLQRARRNWALAAAQGHEAAREALGDTGGGADIADALAAGLAAAAAAPGARRQRRRARGATQDGLLYHLDNPAHRRVKPVFMTGAELWKLFRPKALAAGLFPMLLKHAGRRRAEEAERQRLEEEKRKKEAEERAKAAAAGGGGEAATKAEKQPKKPAVEKYDGPKMKQLYWSKLDNVEGTVFAGGGGDDAHDASVLGDLLEHFGPQAAKFKDLKSADELVRALEDCDAAHLTADNCAGLAEHCPEAAECEACAAYLESGGDPALLGRADKFCAAVAPLQKTLRARLDAIRAKLTYDEDAQAIRDDAKVLSWAAEQAKSSDKLKRIMLLLLKLGNALNRGTARGGASGIKLDALQQMGRTKTNGGITLLRYVVERVEPREPELLELRRDMPDVAAAKRKNLDQMKQDFAKIKAAVAKTGATLKVAAKAGDQKLLRAVGPWHRDAALDLDALERELDAARSDVHDALKFFGEDPAVTDLGTFYGLLEDFMKSLEDTRAAMAAEKRRREQEEKKAKEKASRKAAKQAMHQDPHRPL